MERERNESPKLTEEQAIEILNSHEHGSPEAMEAWGRYVDQCNEEAVREGQETPEDPVVTNRATIKAMIKIAEACLKSERYYQEGMDQLYDALDAAEQNDSTKDLANEIQRIGEQYDRG